MARRLSPAEEDMLRFIVRREVVTKDAAMIHLYGLRCADEVPQPKILDVMVCRIKKRLKPHNITIENVWGVGWKMPRDDKRRVAATGLLS